LSLLDKSQSTVCYVVGGCDVERRTDAEFSIHRRSAPTPPREKIITSQLDIPHFCLILTLEAYTDTHSCRHLIRFVRNILATFLQKCG